MLVQQHHSGSMILMFGFTGICNAASPSMDIIMPPKIARLNAFLHLSQGSIGLAALSSQLELTHETSHAHVDSMCHQSPCLADLDLF